MLFFWKKRDEGFEWHKYVRTTIKLRRESRRQKAHQVGVHVAEGVKAAGAAADDLARRGAARVGEGAKVAGAAADVMARRGAERVGEGAQVLAADLSRMTISGVALAGLGLGALAKWLGVKLAPLIDLLGRPGVAGPLTLVGLIAALAGAGRLIFAANGVDAEAFAALGIGLLCMGLGLGPTLWHGHAVLPRLFAAPVTGLPSRPWLVAGVAGIVALIGAIAFSLAPGRLSVPLVSSMTGLSFGGSSDIKGRASVIAANVVRVGGASVRLTGIEVPEPDQRCVRAGQRAGRTWPCGQDAREATQRLVQGQSITCEVGRKDSSGMAHGRCKAGGADVAEALVRAGYAFAESGLVSPYRGAEDSARTAKAGIWNSADPERPAVWRERIWAAAKRQAPDGCPIKGRVRRGEREYLLPWSSDYERVRISTRRGERWFCSEDEAVSAGWRSAARG